MLQTLLFVVLSVACMIAARECMDAAQLSYLRRVGQATTGTVVETELAGATFSTAPRACVTVRVDLSPSFRIRHCNCSLPTGARVAVLYLAEKPMGSAVVDCHGL